MAACCPCHHSNGRLNKEPHGAEVVQECEDECRKPAGFDQVHVLVSRENETVTSNAPKTYGKFKSQIQSMMSQRSKNADSVELGGIGYGRQSSRNELGFTKDYLSGSLRFVGSSADDKIGNKYTNHKYMAVQPDEEASVIVNALEKKWKLNMPNLLICILGGEELSQSNQVMGKAFRKGLVEALLSTDVWLFTGGLDCGIMQSVGQALTDYAMGRAIVQHRNVVAIGVASLGIVNQKEKLLGSERKSIKYHMRSNKDGNSDKSYHLEPNHTHFLLVGDEHSKKGSEDNLRVQLIRRISKVAIKGSNAMVPVLYLMFGGDASSLQTVYDNVKDHKIPVLIIPDSGGAADVLKYAITSEQTKTESLQQISFDVRLNHEVCCKMDVDPANVVHVKEQVKEIIKRRHLISIYNEDVRIDDAILQALMKANRGAKGQDELQLAVIWNRIDLVKKEFVLNKNWKDEELKSSLYYALVNDQPKFVSLFLDDGCFDLREFLSQRVLTDLYNQINESSILRTLLDQQRANRAYHGSFLFTLADVSGVLKELIFDMYEPLYEKQLYKDPKAHFRDPYRELFLLAILQNRREMALFFWEKGPPSLGGALVAYKLLTAMSSRLSLDPHQETEILQHSKEYQKMSIQMLSLCFEEDRRRTSLLLVCKCPKWGNVPYLDIAAEARNKRFIAHAGVQNLLSELWMGRISRNTGLVKIWFCLFVPFSYLFLITFMSKDDPTVPATRKLEHTISEDDTDHGLSCENIAKPKKRKRKDFYQAAATVDEADDGMSVKTHITYKPTNTGLSTLHKVKLFYDAPVISFRTNTVAHFVFLALFSYILLANFTEQVSIYEYVLMGWVFTLFTEELRQLFDEEYRTIRHRFTAWLWGYWNCMDLLSLVLYSLGTAMRFHPITLEAARIVLGLDLIVFYVRILHIFSASELLGPKLIMIVKMTVDLMAFFAILMVFLTAYGVACQAILFPNTQDVSTIFVGIFYTSYFQLYGELFLNDIHKNNCTSAGEAVVEGIPMCPEHPWFGTLVLAVYMFISNILLLNLLIAMLNYTFHNVQENTDIFWKFQRYQLVKEYYRRPAIVPPFIIVVHIYKMFRWMCDKCCPDNNLYRSSNLMKKTMKPEKQIEISAWERVKGEDYLTQQNDPDELNSYMRMRQTDAKLDNLSGKITKYFEGSKINKEIEKRFNILEAQISCIEEMLSGHPGTEAVDGVHENPRMTHLLSLRHRRPRKLSAKPLSPT